MLPSLMDFEEAVEATNRVLSELNEETIQIPNKYFSRNITRVKKREKFSETKPAILSTEIQLVFGWDA